MVEDVPNTYALADASGRGFEIFTAPPGVKLADMLHADLVKGAVNVTGRTPPAVGMVKSGSGFASPKKNQAAQSRQASRMLGAGVALVSKADPELAGTYPVDPASLTTLMLLAKSAEAAPKSGPVERLRVYDSNGDAKLMTGQQIAKILAAAEAHHDALRAVINGRSTAMPAKGPVVID